MAKKKKRETLEERENRESREGTRILIMGVAAFALFIVVMGGALAIFNTVESSAVVDLYGETAASACAPVPVGSMSTDYLPDEGPPRSLILLTADSQRRHAWHSDLPTQWRAEDEASVVLVGCVAEDYIELEECTYTRESNRGDSFQVRISREQHTATVSLINPTTGQRVDELTLTGSEPAACPEDTGELNSGRERGEDLTLEDFALWIEDYVLE